MLSAAGCLSMYDFFVTTRSQRVSKFSFFSQISNKFITFRNVSNIDQEVLVVLVLLGNFRDNFE